MAGIPPPPGRNPTLQKPPGYRDPSAAPPQLRPPLRKQPLPPSFRPDARKHRRHRSRCSCGRCFCCTLLVVLVIIFVLAIASAVCYLYFQPKLPVFHLQSLKVTRFNVTIKPDGTFLTAATAASVQATNPNGKIVYSYKQGEATFSVIDDDGDVSLGSDTFQGFKQGTKNSTVVKVVAGVKGVMIDDGVGSRLESRFQSKDLKFMVEMRTELKVRVTGGIAVKLPVKILCGEVSLKQMGGGALPKCTINLLRWINLH